MDSEIENIKRQKELTRLRLGDGKNDHTSFFGEIRELDIVTLFILEDEVR